MADEPTNHNGAGYFAEEAATFGDRLAAARDAQLLTQSDLAARLGVLPKTIRNWEEDRSEPRANKLQMLCGLLNVSMLWLTSGTGDGLDDTQAMPIEAREALTELRAIQAESLRLSSRLGLLEKRLRGMIG